MLSEGDQTKVGSNGVSLSGGQKARLSLARAVYSDADIYLFDDPISAVDSKVAKEIFENCFVKLKRLNKTVILATHHLSFIGQCDEVICLSNGSIVDKQSTFLLMQALTSGQLRKREKDRCRVMKN